MPESVDEVIAETAERPLGGEDVPRRPRSSQRGRFPGERLMSPTYELATGFAGEFALLAREQRANTAKRLRN